LQITEKFSNAFRGHLISMNSLWSTGIVWLSVSVRSYLSYGVASEPAYYQYIAQATWVYSTGMRTTIEEHDLGQYQPGMES
jgi:hypothetical protein